MSRTLVTGAVVTALMTAAPALTQSLGELARQEREKREKANKAGASVPSYTDADLSKHRPASGHTGEALDAATPSPAPSPTRTSYGTTTTGDPRLAQEEALWRQQVARARARIEAAQKHLESLKGEWWLPGRRLTTELQRRTEAAERRLKEAQDHLERLHDQARRQGVPPGWLR